MRSKAIAMYTKAEIPDRKRLAECVVGVGSALEESYALFNVDVSSN
jgi:hypothetical protein